MKYYKSPKENMWKNRKIIHKFETKIKAVSNILFIERC